MPGTPERFGPYTVLVRHDGALWRDLYLARHDALGTRAILWASTAGSPADREAWLDGVRAAPRFAAPGVLSIVETGRTDRAAFVALRPVARPLGSFLSAMPPLAARLQLAERVCAALAAVHDEGLLHGGLVPDAVFVDDDGAACLMPPGLPAPPGEGEGRRAEPDSHLAGPPDARRDVHDLGLLLYFIFSGRDVFSRERYEQLRGEVGAASLEGLDAIDPALRPLVGRALGADRTRSFAHAGDVLSELRLAVAGLVGGEVEPSAGAEPPPSRPEARVGAAPAPAGGEEERLEPPKPYDDNVQFTVYRPRALEPGRWHPMLVFAHLAERRAGAPPGEPEPLQVVAEQAAAILGDTGAYRTHGEDSAQPVPHDGEITFVPSAEGVEFNPPSRSFRWTESVHREEFRMRASPAAAGRVVHGRVSVFLGSIVLAEIGMSLRVAGQGIPADPAGTSEGARPYRKIFASYSHRDRAVVEEFSEYARAVGDRYLVDVVDLRSGERWGPALEELIRQADVFQLFWSWHALQSPFVRQEWQYALALNRPRFVRPVYWDDPLPSAGDLPPDALRALHFQRIRPARVSIARAPAPGLPPSPSPAAPQAPPPASAQTAQPAPAPRAGRAPAPGPVAARRGWLRTAAPALAALAVLALMLPVLLNQAPGSIDQGSTDATELPPLAEGPAPGDAAGDPVEEQVVALVADAQAAWNAGDALRAVQLIETAAARDPEHPALTAAVSRMHTDAARRVDRASAAAKARRVAPAPIAAGVRRRARADALQREGNRIAALRELVETADALERARPARDLDPSR